MKIEEMEKRAYRTSWSPWLWDLYLSGVLLMLALFVSYNRGGDGVWGLLIFGLAMVVWGVLMKWTQSRVVKPRVGEAVFGKKRRERKWRTVWVFAGSVLLGVVVLVLTPWLMGLGSRFGGGIWLLALFGLQAIVVFSLLGYYQDYPHGYVWGWLFALAIPSVELSIDQWGLHLPVFVMAASGVMGVLGVSGLRNFLREYPLSAEALELESSAEETGGH